MPTTRGMACWHGLLGSRGVVPAKSPAVSPPSTHRFEGGSLHREGVGMVATPLEGQVTTRTVSILLVRPPVAAPGQSSGGRPRESTQLRYREQTPGPKAAGPARHPRGGSVR
jgi:hypothetical protein